MTVPPPRMAVEPPRGELAGSTTPAAVQHREHLAKAPMQRPAGPQWAADGRVPRTDWAERPEPARFTPAAAGLSGDERSWAEELWAQELWADEAWPREAYVEEAWPGEAGAPGSTEPPADPPTLAPATLGPATLEPVTPGPAPAGPTPPGESPAVEPPRGSRPAGDEAGRRRRAETELIPAFSDLTQLISQVEGGPADRPEVAGVAYPPRRPRPRPRRATGGAAGVDGDRSTAADRSTATPPARSTVYVSRHAAEPA